MRRLVLIALVFLVAGCAPRAELFLDPRDAPPEEVLPVFVGTTRALDPEEGFVSDRSSDIRFLRYDISVPPDREPGEVTHPEWAVEPEKDFLVRDGRGFGSARAFREDLGRELMGRGRSAREVVIYVHGFNNNFAEGVLRMAQLSSDFDLPGVPVHYAWPSAANPLGYVHDRDSVLFARDGLEALIDEVEAAGARRVIIVAHSLGSMLTMEVLRQMAIARPGSVSRRVDGVILLSPDLDVDVFRRQAARIGQLPQPFGIFVSKRDRVLALSARLSGERNRLGNVNSVQQVADLDVTIVDVTEFSRGLGHLTAATSPALIELFSRAPDIDAAFEGASAGRAGLFPGTVLTVQNATEIILSPVTELGRALAQ